MNVNALDELSPADLEHIDEHLAREVFQSEVVQPYSTCIKASRRLQAKLIGLYYCHHELVDEPGGGHAARFTLRDLNVTAICASREEAVALAALAFHRRTSDE